MVSIIDPIWSITPPSVGAGSCTANGEVAFPFASNDRFFCEGDLILSDSCMSWNGYHSDFSAQDVAREADPPPVTRPSSTASGQWQEVAAAVTAVLKPGASAGDPCVRRWPLQNLKYGFAHFYLGHGVGCDSAEMPFIGSDLGLAFDDTIELVPSA